LFWHLFFYGSYFSFYQFLSHTRMMLFQELHCLPVTGLDKWIHQILENGLTLCCYSCLGEFHGRYSVFKSQYEIILIEFHYICTFLILRKVQYCNLFVRVMFTVEICNPVWSRYSVSDVFKRNSAYFIRVGYSFIDDTNLIFIFIHLCFLRWYFQKHGLHNVKHRTISG
jgi:hypothetical protein